LWYLLQLNKPLRPWRYDRTTPQWKNFTYLCIPQLSIYDLRHLPRSQAHNQSEAYLHFPEYRSDPIPRGFDIAPNIIAAGGPDASVQLFNSNTGDKISSRRAQAAQAMPQHFPEVKCLSFLDMEDSMRSPALLLGCGSYLETWS